MAPERKSLKNIIILVLIIIICITVITVSFRQSDAFTRFKSAALDYFRPVQEKTYQLFRPVSSFFAGIKDYFGLRDKLEKLRQENALITKDYSENINLKIENDALRKLIGIDIRSDYGTVPAKVIGYYNTKWQSEVLINKGKSDGVVEGMAVVNEDGLVGVIVLASSESSSVRLLSDPQSSIGARILSSRKLGLVEGSTDRKIYLNYIASDDLVFKGDILITSEYGQYIPPEILIGRIKRIGIAEQNLYRQIEVEPFVDFKKLEHVLVIKG
ncbi:MAG: rod shape-determining protein MreC [Actinobacteria bacterium]|nr:rod shape-determining protein MreC [Actinomycetota bacterium]